MEAVVLVCDYGDGRAAAEQVTMRVGGRNLIIDLCPLHLRELTTNARAPKRGRRPKAVVNASPKARHRGRPSASAKRTTKRTSAKKASTRK